MRVTCKEREAAHVSSPRDYARIGRRSKRKGARFELEIADELRVVWPMARRGIGQARFGGEVPDVDCTPFWVECKHRAHPNVPAALAQATEAATSQKSTKPPLAVTRANGGPIVASLYLADFLKLVERLERAEKQNLERAGIELAHLVGATVAPGAKDG
jgi:hypothetical protein